MEFAVPCDRRQRVKGKLLGEVVIYVVHNEFQFHAVVGAEFAVLGSVARLSELSLTHGGENAEEVHINSSVGNGRL